jgi:hypothetical protein
LVPSESSTRISNLLKYFEDKSKETDAPTHPELLSPRSKLQIQKERGTTTPRSNKDQSSPRDGALQASAPPSNNNVPPNNRRLQSDHKSTSTPNLQGFIQQALTLGSLSETKPKNQNIAPSNTLSNQSNDSHSTVALTTPTLIQSSTNVNTVETQPSQSSLPLSTNTQNKTTASQLSTIIEKIPKSETKEPVSDATASLKTLSTTKTTDRLR